MQYFPLTWLILSVPVLLAFAAVYCVTRRQGKQPWRSLAKSGAAFIAAMPFTLEPGYTVFAIGAGLFSVSDLFVARGIYTQTSERESNLVLLLYYAGVYAMASVVLFL